MTIGAQRPSTNAPMMIKQPFAPKVRRLILCSSGSRSHSHTSRCVKPGRRLSRCPRFPVDPRVASAEHRPQKSAGGRPRFVWTGDLVRSLLKSSGIWGSGLDTLLTALRDVIKEHHEVFPAERLEQVLAERGKSLAFGPEEIEDLLDMEYGDRRMFPLLSILYPFIDVRQHHHVDHFFPKSRLNRRVLEKVGMEADQIEECVSVRDRLANLQLLEGLLNVSKNDALPDAWMKATYSDPVQRQAVLDRHDLGEIPLSAMDFMSFYTARRERMRSRLTTLLTKPAPITAGTTGERASTSDRSRSPKSGIRCSSAASEAFPFWKGGQGLRRNP